ncbi:hypothetical protein ACFS5N_17585 [Mucilaginibacter ximonensis]|uniref:MG2 domain-containing protein n=1 Tax=Mucilaginibacter ximonensis TaxID=538021 RepID=A0ABW5YG75_9SPHI
MKTSALTFIAALFGVIFLAFIPRDDLPLDKLITNLQRWTDSIPQEKVYLHMDKPYYALGDTIWFKGYLTIGARHQLSKLSGAVYVELINERDSLLQQLKLPVTSGMVMGDFILGDDFEQGNYRIRAYTQWMRNAGDDYFYDHTFLVGDAGGSIIAQANFNYRNNNGKPELSALLNYTNDSGSAIGEKDVRFEIRQKDKVFWQQNAKTDALGSLKIIIPEDVRKNPSGAYIHTIVRANAKYPAIRDFSIKFGFSQSDVQVFPESGNLVNGIPSHVAFKAVSIDGSGINIRGSVTDNEHQEIAKIQTLHAGMGSFSLTPQQGKTYTAHITFDDGSTRIIPLPPAADQGYVLSVYQPNKDSVLVRIHASAALLQSSVSLISQTNGEIEFSSPIKIEKRITSLWLDKKSFPTGITQFTLFSSAGEPLNERLAFIRSNDQMALDIKAGKATYSSKEHIQITVNAKNSKGLPTVGNFSVAVIDESRVPVEENREYTIFSSLLLTSDLKGYVEQPNYYFAQKGDEVDKALDNLMLTQGYRRFVWKHLAGTVSIKPKFAVENLGSVISGKVSTLGHKPLANASVMLTSLRARVTKLTTTDSAGRFKFDKLFITDSMKITVQARNGKSDKVITTMDTVPRITINPNPNWPELSTNINNSLKAYMTTLKQQDDIYEKSGQLDKMHRLREVRIRIRKPVPPPYKDQMGYKIPEEFVSFSYLMPEGVDYPNFGIYLQAHVPGMIVKPVGTIVSYPFLLYQPPVGTPHYAPARVMVDGRLLTTNELGDMMDNDYIEPEGIFKVDIVRSGAGPIAYLGGPAILIYTKRDYMRKPYTPSVVNFTPKGYNKVREFYSPKYDTPNANLTLPDLRSTVYWSPYIKTDASGKTTFSFFNADGPGRYKVTIEGINADGQLGRQVYRYTVNEMQASTGK